MTNQVYLRYYLINAHQSSKSDKVVEFFEKMSPDLMGKVPMEFFTLTLHFPSTLYYIVILIYLELLEEARYNVAVWYYCHGLNFAEFKLAYLQDMWKEWYCFPYVKNPETNYIFEPYFR